MWDNILQLIDFLPKSSLNIIITCFFCLIGWVVWVFKDKIWYQGENAGVNIPKPQPHQSTVSFKAPIVDKWINFFDESLMLTRLDELETALPEDFQQISDKDKVEKLKYLASAFWLGLLCEREYDQIWGSQLAALLELNSNAYLKKDELKKHYQQAADTYQILYGEYSYDQWLSFLKDRGLILIDENDCISLTIAGKDFLNYLVKEGHSLNKSF